MNYKNFNAHALRKDLRLNLSEMTDYGDFEKEFLKILNKHAPTKKKVVRANDKPYITKALRKAIMFRSSLKNKYMRYKTLDSQRAYKKQKNYTNRLLKKEKKRYFGKIDLSNLTDNKKFWQTMKPLMGNSNNGVRKINLVENNEVIADDDEDAIVYCTLAATVQ